MRVAILGGGGFLASHLARILRETQPAAAIVAVDVVRAVAKDRVVPGVEYHTGVDLGDNDGAAALLRGADVVINTTGFASFWQRDVARLFEVNADLACACGQLCLRAGVPWLIHVSSVAAIGYAGKTVIDESHEHDWIDARRRRKWYMVSKREGDLLLAATGVTRTTVYPGLMLGPGDRVNTHRIVASSRGLAIAPPGGTNVVDVRDVAAGIVRILEKRAIGKRYILGGRNLSFEELGRHARRAQGLSDRVTRVPEWIGGPIGLAARIGEAVNTRPMGLPYDSIASAFQWRFHSSELATHEVGYAPRFDLTTTFRDAIAWREKEGV